MNNASNKAAIPNPALQHFNVLIGDWKTIGKHPMVPDTILEGRTSFRWMEGGAFLLMHAEIFHDQFPAGVAIFGSDNLLETYFMLYFDERGISRKQDVLFQDNVLKWWRNAPGFSQRYTFTFNADRNTIISKGEISKDDSNWEDDLDLTYTRIG
jgi:hypothetical protein